MKQLLEEGGKQDGRKNMNGGRVKEIKEVAARGRRYACKEPQGMPTVHRAADLSDHFLSQKRHF